MSSKKDNSFMVSFKRLSAKMLGPLVTTTIFGDHSPLLTKAANDSEGASGLTTQLCYVLQYEAGSDAVLLDKEARRLNYAEVYRPLQYAEFYEQQSVLYLHRAQSLVDLLMEGKPAFHQKLIRMITAVQQHDNYDINLAPVSVFWGRNPEKEDSLVKLFFGDSFQPPTVLKQTINVAMYGRDNYIQFHEPVSLRALVARFMADDVEFMADQIMLHLSKVLDVHRELMLGPDLSDRRNIVKGLVHSPVVQQAINAEMASQNISEPEATKRAAGYLNEIVSDYNYSTVRLFSRSLSWLWTQLYDGVEVHNFEQVRKIAEDYQVVYTPSHRSHIDYLLLSYIIHNRGMMIPYIAAGDNLDMPVVGRILRGGGAFFIRRSFKGLPLYAAVLKEYLNSIIKRNTPIEYFIEGGRSRTGRLLQPKMGILAMTVNSYLRRESSKPIAFIPAYIGYERLMEGGSYVGEMYGKPKESESIWGLIKSLRKIEKIYGKVHVNFGEPVFLDSVLHAHDIPPTLVLDAEQKPPEAVQQVVATLAQTIQENINKAAVINPVSLLSLVLLSAPKHALDEAMCVKQLDLYRGFAQAGTYDEAVEVTTLSGEEIIAYGLRLKLITRVPHVLGNLVVVAEKQSELLSYFRNNIAHVFIVSSFIASLVIRNGKLAKYEVYQVIESLYPFLKAELFLKWRPEVMRDVVDREMNALLVAGLLQADKANLYAPDMNSEEYAQIQVMANPIHQSLQRYFMTIALIGRMGSDNMTIQQAQDVSQLLAQRLSILFESNSPDSFDKTLFSGFVVTLEQQGYLYTNSEGRICFGELLNNMAAQANLVLSKDTQQTIDHITNLSVAEVSEAMVALQAKSKKRKGS